MVELQLTLFSDKTHTISAASKLSSLKYLHATELRSHSQLVTFIVSTSRSSATFQQQSTEYIVQRRKDRQPNKNMT